MQSLKLPKQPPVYISYFRVGKLLYASLILFALESWFYYYLMQKSFSNNSEILGTFWFCAFIFAFVHIFLVIMDGWSRFQNYKRAKDQLYSYGFNKRIALQYKTSNCQRNAAIVAASELGMEKEIRNFYRSIGVKNYHLLPEFIQKDPIFLFRKHFWSRTFLEKYYKPKFDYHNLSKSSILANN